MTHALVYFTRILKRTLQFSLKLCKANSVKKNKFRNRVMWRIEEPKQHRIAGTPESSRQLHEQTKGKKEEH